MSDAGAPTAARIGGVTAPSGIFEIDRIEARLAPYEWSFAQDCAADIDAMWARDVAAKPALFNGRVLLMQQGALEARVFRAAYFETDYKPFYCWHRMGYPLPAVRNGFAMAALRARDGAFLCGVMGGHTANAGKIYFAAGTPDMGDVQADGSVDLAGSVLRELEEETGITAAEVTSGAGFTALVSPVRAAFMKPVAIDLMADEARALMLARIKTQSDQELSDIYIVRSRADIIEARMPVFLREYLDREFGV